MAIPFLPAIAMAGKFLLRSETARRVLRLSAPKLAASGGNMFGIKKKLRKIFSPGKTSSPVIVEAAAATLPAIIPQVSGLIRSAGRAIAPFARRVVPGAGLVLGAQYGLDMLQRSPLAGPVQYGARMAKGLRFNPQSGMYSRRKKRTLVSTRDIEGCRKVARLVKCFGYKPAFAYRKRRASSCK